MYRQRIQDSYDCLSKGQRRIADFVITSHRQAAFMTASQLADELHVDVATITRFAQRLGYLGYPELLAEVRAVVQQEMSVGFRPLDVAATDGKRFRRALDIERENLERTIAAISHESADQAINAILRARTVFILGQHAPSYLAELFALRLQSLSITALAIACESVRVALTMRHISAQDVVIGLGFSGYSSDVAAVMQIARLRGAKTIGISGSALSPVSRASDILLLCVCSTDLHLPSQVTMMAIIDALFQTLGHQLSDRIGQNLEAFDRFYKDFAARLQRPTTSIEESLLKVY